VFGNLHVPDAFAASGGVIDERVEFAVHFGVGRRPLSRGAFRKRVPDSIQCTHTQKVRIADRVSDVGSRKKGSQRAWTD